jgi:RNA polymerase-binding transcription factor DksA
MQVATEVSQIRQRLEARRQELATRRQRVDRDLARQNEPLTADSDDQAIQLQNDETLEAIGAAARSEIAAIDAALERLTTGRYGICTACGEVVGEARLRAVPHALTCTRCADR